MTRIAHACASALVAAFAAAPALAQTPFADTSTTQGTSVTEQRSNFHFQNTEIFQGDNSFPAKYSGPNSLSPHAQVQHTSTTDLFAGYRLGKGIEAHVDFLMWQGYGISQTLGVEAFPNSDAYKLGTETPNYSFARLFVRKTVGFGGAQEDVVDGQLTLAGKQDVHRLTITAGRLSMLDVFDYNTYANDPHSQFINWGLVGNLTWDYAADSIGYTTGIAADLNQPKWALRYGFFQMPKLPNSFTEDDQALMSPHRGADGPFFKSWSMMTEYERRYTAHARPGAVRLQAWLNEANMADYSAETSILLAGGDPTTARSFRYKHGYGLNWKQEVATGVGMFSRLGWNDGKEEGWAYTDANWSGALGVSLDGSRWRRSGDTFGLAGIVSGASSENQRFLQAGGTGILAGDGALNYGPESVVETYYNAKLGKTLFLCPDFQYIRNPAFNRDRGPVSVASFRAHVEF